MKRLNQSLRKTLGAREWRLLVVVVAITFVLACINAYYFYVLKLRTALFWNLGLAMLPMVFAVPLVYTVKRGGLQWLAVLMGFLWLVFFPNAPYMLTDLVHLDLYTHFDATGAASQSVLPWLGLVHIELGVFLGCLYGLLSLYMLQSLVAKRFGKLVGWVFSGFVCALSGVAIYIGRFLRLNTWDIATRPLGLLKEIFGVLGRGMVKLSILFAFLTLVVYILFYATFSAAKNKEADEEMEFDPSKLAYCGLYCPQCSFLVACETRNMRHVANMPEKYARFRDMRFEELACGGCKGANNCGPCGIKDCAEQKSVAHCAACGRFPCETLLAFAADGVPHHAAALENLKTIRAVGGNGVV